MGHIHKQLTEAELRVEIARIQDGAVSSFTTQLNQGMTGPLSEPQALIVSKKRRGRPPGSRNKVKSPKGS